MSLVTNISPKVGIKCTYLNRKLISDVDEPHAPLKAAITSSISTIVKLFMITGQATLRYR